VCQLGNVIAPLALRLPYGANISKSAPQGKRPSTFRVVKDGQEVPPSELPVQRAAASGQEVRESEITVVFGPWHRARNVGQCRATPGSRRQGPRSDWCFVDITEHKRAEQALQESQAVLARVAQIVTMGELTASIAHDINQPLAAVTT
jgi:signal transduction histidine kinase